MQAGPEETKFINTETLKTEDPTSYKLFNDIALYEDKAEIEYLTQLARNMMDALFQLRTDEDDGLDFVAYLIQLRFAQTKDITNVFRKTEFFTSIFLKMLAYEMNFVVNLRSKDTTTFTQLRDLILAIEEDEEEPSEEISSEGEEDEALEKEGEPTKAAKEDDEEKEVQLKEIPLKGESKKHANLIALFTESLKKPGVIRLLLPLYHDFLLAASNQENAKRNFIGQVSLPFESFLTKNLYEINGENDPSILKRMSKNLIELRKALWQPLLDELDKALPEYEAPTFPFETLNVVKELWEDEKLVKAFEKYAEVVKSAQQFADEWHKYAYSFRIQSPLRQFFLNLEKDIHQKVTELQKSLTTNTLTAKEAEGKIKAFDETIKEWVEEHKEYKEAFEPFKVRTKELTRLFKELGDSFSYPTARETYFGIAQRIKDKLALLENDLGEDNEEDFEELIEDAQKELTEYLKNRINAKMGEQTPAQRISNLRGLATDEQRKQELDLLLKRLKTEGADVDGPTQHYGFRPLTTATTDFVKNAFTLQNPLTPRARSAIDIAEMYGSSKETLAELRAKPAVEAEPPKPSMWSKAHPREMWKTVSPYLGNARALSKLLVDSYDALKKRFPSFTKQAEEAPVSRPRTESGDVRREALAQSGYKAFTPAHDDPNWKGKEKAPDTASPPPTARPIVPPRPASLKPGGVRLKVN